LKSRQENLTRRQKQQQLSLDMYQPSKESNQTNNVSNSSTANSLDGFIELDVSCFVFVLRFTIYKSHIHKKVEEDVGIHRQLDNNNNNNNMNQSIFKNSVI
jgi:hypothetical protein